MLLVGLCRAFYLFVKGFSLLWHFVLYAKNLSISKLHVVKLIKNDNVNHWKIGRIKTTSACNILYHDDF